MMRQLLARSLMCAMGALAIAAPGAQTDRFVGRWEASEPDRGVVIAVAIGESSTLTLPGARLDGTVQALTLKIANLMTAGDRATFSVDLPEDEGTLELELRVAAADDSAALKVIRSSDGSPEDFPTWNLRRARTR